MTAAIFAARQGAQVTLAEHKDRVGKKLLSTGNGRCNYTNEQMGPDCFFSGLPDFPRPSLKRFGTGEAVEFFKELGIWPKIRNGYYYPRSDQASSVLDALRYELERQKVSVLTDFVPEQITRRRDGFLVKGKTDTLKGRSLILACGGKAAPATGSDGSGFGLAESLGHRVVKPVPALVSLRCREIFFKQLAGIRTDGEVSLYIEGKLAAAQRGEIQLTATGISGIPVFQLSHLASRALDEKKKVTARLDFLPDIRFTEAVSYLETHERRTWSGLVHKKLLALLLKEDLTCKAYAKKLKQFTVAIESTGGFEQAQVTCGGVDVSMVDPDTMMSKLVPELYFAGEILDVNGLCGGYNLQWAWSSGFAAGTAAGSGRKMGGNT